MLAAFGVDVLDPAVSVRRVHVLLERLPPHARSMGEQWGTESELLAHVLDAVNHLTWVTSSAYGGKGPAPRPITRPPLRDRAQPQAHQAAPHLDGRQLAAQGGAVKTESWSDAGLLLAGMPGMRVHGG